MAALAGVRHGDSNPQQAGADTLSDIQLFDPAPTERRRLSQEHRDALSLLNAKQRIQTLALELRNDVAVALRLGKCGNAIQLRAGQNRARVVRTAIALEKQAGADGEVIAALYVHHERMRKGLISPQEKAQKIIQRLQEGQPPRVNNDDLTEQEARALLEAAANYPEILDIVECMLEQRKLYKRMLQQDTKFPLLLSYSSFLQRLDLEPKMAGVFLFADISNFKSVNDEWGQAFVDAVVLRTLAEKLPPELRRMSPKRVLICRQGGDEFMVFFEGVKKQWEAARLFAYTFKKALAGVSEDLVQEHWRLLNAGIRTRSREEMNARDQQAVKKGIQERIRNFECKIGVDFRASGMSAKEAESNADSYMIRTKAYKELGFPTAMQAFPDVIRNALTGEEVAYKVPAPKPR